MASRFKGIGALVLPVWLAGCAGLTTSQQPELASSACVVLKHNTDLRLAVQDARAHWEMPPEVALALLEPPPGQASKRQVLPYGNAWDEYRVATQNWSASPHDLVDAVDFLGWNTQRSRQKLKLEWTQVDALYLAYRLGPGAYSQGIHRGIWIEKESKDVAARAARYAAELNECPALVEPSRWHWRRFWSQLWNW